MFLLIASILGLQGKAVECFQVSEGVHFILLNITPKYIKQDQALIWYKGIPLNLSTFGYW